MAHRYVVAAALLLLALPAQAGEWRALDGDTVVSRAAGERIRLLGVDTAELRAHCQAELDLARAAKRFTAAALERGPVTITRTRLDQYGRTLAELWR